MRLFLGLVAIAAKEFAAFEAGGDVLDHVAQLGEFGSVGLARGVGGEEPGAHEAEEIEIAFFVEGRVIFRVRPFIEGLGLFELGVLLGELGLERSSTTLKVVPTPPEPRRDTIRYWCSWNSIIWSSVQNRAGGAMGLGASPSSAERSVSKPFRVARWSGVALSPRANRSTTCWLRRSGRPSKISFIEAHRP